MRNNIHLSKCQPFLDPVTTRLGSESTNPNWKMVGSLFGIATLWLQSVKPRPSDWLGLLSDIFNTTFADSETVPMLIIVRTVAQPYDLESVRLAVPVPVSLSLSHITLVRA